MKFEVSRAAWKQVCMLVYQSILCF
uniref:Uncharacterized protein n=1 Tax=Arundo donax TaxID=35708 RepID=A0A0A9GJD7_ARUDO